LKGATADKDFQVGKKKDGVYLFTDVRSEGHPVCADRGGGGKENYRRRRGGVGSSEGLGKRTEIMRLLRQATLRLEIKRALVGRAHTNCAHRGSRVLGRKNRLLIKPNERIECRGRKRKKKVVVLWRWKSDRMKGRWLGEKECRVSRKAGQPWGKLARLGQKETRCLRIEKRGRVVLQ